MIWLDSEMDEEEEGWSVFTACSTDRIVGCIIIFFRKNEVAATQKVEKIQGAMIKGYKAAFEQLRIQKAQCATGLVTQHMSPVLRQNQISHLDV
jgi:hypothetical protein